ncbi:phenylacetate--CoA ligase family protein [Halobellus sp. Atlit-38R]|uniref:phenylacetate--CoA ligase family protein n=1 Tax=Halobellus sp. Atlit-38R TaxID=2282131 RepID=UPI000EF1E2C4|nr:phenylacetate--CoA ligase family protein [Halobellus sp. Atlit-38R]RLM89225.1 phenylacetate--CoA ligase family protein [Halobellus sp. Atlit-38R]
MSDVYDSIETEPWAEIQERHSELLDQQVDYLAAESEYYQRKFDEWGIDPDDIDSIEALRAVPFTTKDDERACQVETDPERPLGEHQAVATERLNRTISSSGTTGKPTYFGLTEQDRKKWNQVLKRCFYAAGIRPDDTLIFGVGQTMVPGGTPYFEGLTKLGSNVVPAGGGTTERLLSATTDLDGDVLFTTTSHLRYLSERAPELLDHDVDELPVTKLIGGGGPGIANPEIREELYDVWDATDVREIMGLGDVVACLWSECEAENGMHFHGQEHAHVELVDPETEEVVPFEDGAEGELVYTPLQREATPLLRFRSGDVARVTGTECECGRTSPKIQCIGRTDDMLIYKGMNVFPSAIRDVVSDVDGAQPHVRVIVPDADQVHFEKPIPLEVVVDPDTARSEDEIAGDVVDAVRSHLKVRVEPRLVDLDDIELSEYKADLVVVED